MVLGQGLGCPCLGTRSRRKSGVSPLGTSLPPGVAVGGVVVDSSWSVTTLGAGGFPGSPLPASPRQSPTPCQCSLQDASPATASDGPGLRKHKTSKLHQRRIEPPGEACPPSKAAARRFRCQPLGPASATSRSRRTASRPTGTVWCPAVVRAQSDQPDPTQDHKGSPADRNDRHPPRVQCRRGEEDHSHDNGCRPNPGKGCVNGRRYPGPEACARRDKAPKCKFPGSCRNGIVRARTIRGGIVCRPGQGHNKDRTSE